MGFLSGAMVKNPSASAGDIRETGSIPGLGRSPGEGNGYPLWYSCLENPMDRGPWRATVHGVTKSQTRLKQLSTHAYITLRVIKRRKQPVAVEKDRRVLDLDGAILDNFSEELAPSEDVNDIVMPPE